VRAVALVLAVAVVAACGGEERYAGLTRGEAEARLASRLAVAEARGELGSRLGEAIAGTSEEAMARAGVADGGAPRVSRDAAKIVRGETRAGTEAWVGRYVLAGVGSALAVCVYVGESGSAVDVRARC
jgi:hypothetical protein